MKITKKLFSRDNIYIFRELFRANLKARDHNSILGVLWGILSPLVLLVVMYLIFRYKFGSAIPAYALHLFIGIIFINFFLTVTGYSLGIFSSYRDFILNSTMPREILVLSNVAIHGYKFIVELLVCCLLSIYLGLFSIKAFLMLFPLVISFLLMVAGIIFILSTIYCFARDIGHIWGLASRLLFFATPVFYSLDNISPVAAKIIYYANPLTPFLVTFQKIFLGNGAIDMFSYDYSLVLGFVFFIVGYGFFLKFQSFAVERA